MDDLEEARGRTSSRHCSPRQTSALHHCSTSSGLEIWQEDGVAKTEKEKTCSSQAHPKVVVNKYTMSSEFVRAKVRDSPDQKVQDLWKKLVKAVENTEGLYRYYKATGKL